MTQADFATWFGSLIVEQWTGQQTFAHISPELKDGETPKKQSLSQDFAIPEVFFESPHRLPAKLRKGDHEALTGHEERAGAYLKCCGRDTFEGIGHKFLANQDKDHEQTAFLALYDAIEGEKVYVNSTEAKAGGLTCCNVIWLTIAGVFLLVVAVLASVNASSGSVGSGAGESLKMLERQLLKVEKATNSTLDRLELRITAVDRRVTALERGSFGAPLPTPQVQPTAETSCVDTQGWLNH